MGKKGGGNSWLTVVKRAFRSPTKDSKKKSCRRRDEFDCVPEEEEEKKRGKKRWLFRKTSTNNNNNNNNSGSAYNCAPETPPQSDVKAMKKSSPAQQKRHAAVEINIPTSAATIIQTAFRAYVARRAFGALKGIVKLQALIRGQNVRKQAKMTLKCMQALLRVQARLRDQQARLLSHDVDDDGRGGGGRKSMFAECNNLWESRYLGEVRERKSMSTMNRSSIAEEYYCPRTLEDLQAALRATKEAAALKRERKSLASAFSLRHHHPTWDNDYDINCGYENENEEGEEEERTKWLDKRMATKQWDNCNYTRIGSTDNYNKRDHHSSIKTVEMVETPIPNQYQYQRPTTPNNNYRSFCNNYYYPSPSPSPSKNRLLPGQHVRRSSSPRRTPNKEEKSYYYSTAANTPTSTGSLRSSLLRQHGNNNSLCRRYSVSTNNEGRTGFNANDVAGLMVPSYMAATESAKARVRSQSAPRQRPSTPERDYQQRGGGGSGLAKKRLSFPVPPTTTAATGIINHQNLRSPSFKSLQAGYVGMEQQSNRSCYSTDSFGGGEISPCSTTDMRRWLR